MDRGVETDADGRYALPGWTGLGGGEAAAWAAGYVLGRAKVEEGADQDFALARGTSARGRVLDPSGTPVEGAVVRARSDGDPNGATVDAATTARDGTFAMTSLDPSVSYRFTADLEPFARATSESLAPDPERESIDVGDLRLVQAFAVAGRVVDQDGSPVPGLEVVVGDRGGWRVTDDLGRFRVRGLAEGRHTLRVKGEGREEVTREVPVPGRDVEGIEVRVEGGHELVVVVDAGGEPAPTPLTVAAVGSDGVVRTAHGDATGRISFRLPPGEARVRIRSLPAEWAAPAERTARPGGEPLRLTVERKAAVAGTLVGEDGRPIPFAHLEWRSRGERQAFAATDASGAFRIAVPRDALVDVAFFGTVGRSEAWAEETEVLPLHGAARGVRAGAEGVRIEARRVATDQRLDVRVSAPDGSPAADVVVMLAGQDVRTDADGRASFDGLASRPTRLFAAPAAPDSTWPPLRLDDVVPAGQVVDLRFREGLRLAGRVTRNGSGLGGVSIEARHGEAGFAWTVTAPDGSFAVTVDPDAQFPLVLVARVSGDRPTEVRLDLERAPSGPVEVRVPDR
jgi:hypothetical protein